MAAEARHIAGSILHLPSAVASSAGIQPTLAAGYIALAILPQPSLFAPSTATRQTGEARCIVG